MQDKKENNKQLIFLYFKLQQLQQSCWGRSFRFQNSDLFINFQNKYSIPNIINIRLDDMIYLFILLIINIVFCILPSQNDHILTSAYRQFNVGLFIFSFIWLITPNSFKHLIFVLMLVVFPTFCIGVYLNVIQLQTSSSSTSLTSYLGYFSFWIVFASLYMTYPLKQLIRNRIGAIYSYLYSLSFLTLFFIWPMYSFLEEYVTNSTVTFSFISNNKSLIIAFLIIIVFSFHLFAHSTFFEGNLSKVKSLLLVSYKEEELQMLQLDDSSYRDSIIYDNFNVFMRVMSLIVLCTTLAAQIFVFNYMASNLDQIPKSMMMVVFLIGFPVYGSIMDRINNHKHIAITLASIVSLVPMVFSPLYYNIQFYVYVFLAAVLPYTNLFWSPITLLSSNTPLTKIKIIVIMYMLVHLPVIAFMFDAFGFFANQTTINTLKVVLSAIIAATLLIGLIVVIIWVCSNVESKQSKEDSVKKTIDYNYHEEGNPPYIPYTTKQVFSLQWLTTIDFTNLSIMISSCLFTICQLCTMYTFNQLNNTFVNKQFQSPIIRQVIYHQFVSIGAFYILCNYYIVSPPSISMEIVFGMVLSVGGVFGVAYSFVSGNISMTFRLDGSVFLILLAVFAVCRIIKNNNLSLSKFICPLLMMGLWLFIVVPFIEAIPTGYVYIDTTIYGKYIYGSILISVSIMMVLVGAISLIMNVIMNKFDLERKIKFMTEDVQTYLRDQGVNAEDEVLYILYESYDNRDRKYLYFLKRGYPINIQQDKDYNNKLVPYDQIQSNHPNNQTSVDSCWACLTFCCGNDEEEINQRIVEVANKHIISDEQLINLLPNDILNQPNTKLNSTYQKSIDPSTLYSSNSALLKHAHLTRRYLTDDYTMLQINHDINLEIQLWHKVFQFISNNDQNYPLVIFNDLLMFINMTKIIINRMEFNQLYIQFSNAQWGQIIAMNIDNFSIFIEHIANLLFPQTQPNKKRIKLLLEKVWYNLSQYEQFQQQIMKTYNQHFTKQQIQQSPFNQSQNKYQQHINQQSNHNNQMNKQLKKHQSNKLIQPNQPFQPRIIQSQQQIKIKGVSCKRIIYQKYQSLTKCCSIQNEQEQVIKRNKIKPWEYLAVEVVTILQRKQIKWNEEHQNVEHKFRISFNNIMIAVLKILDLYSYLSISIQDSKIGWINTSFSNLIVSYRLQLYICFVIIIICVPLGIKGVLLILQDRLGLTMARIPAWFPHPMYIFTSIYKLLILSLFSTVSTTLLSTFSCSWISSSPYVLNDDTSIECFSSEHNYYLIASTIGLVIYYPLSAYTMPNFQFSDKILDLKFKPSYLVIYFQINFLLVAAKILLSNISQTTGIEIAYICINITALLLLAISVIYLKPCLIEWFNYVELLLIVIGVIVNACGLLLYLTKYWILSVLIASILSIVFIVSTIIWIKKVYFNKGVFEQSPDELDELQQRWKYNNNKNIALVKQNIDIIQNLQ